MVLILATLIISYLIGILWGIDRYLNFKYHKTLYSIGGQPKYKTNFTTISNGVMRPYENPDFFLNFLGFLMTINNKSPKRIVYFLCGFLYSIFFPVIVIFLFFYNILKWLNEPI